jgi:isopenicillin N synthase-like dioxygenase
MFEMMDDSGRVLQRAFQFMPYDDLDEAYAAGAVGTHPDYFTPNVWPEDPSFRQTWAEYGSATRQLAHTLMSLFARAFGLPGDYFAEAFAHDVSLFSANWYPRQPVSDGQDRELLYGHPDSGVLTVLHQRGSYEGLQVRDRDGSWITMPLLADAFVINIGELMSRWTNGAWPATVHRVIAGPAPTSSRSSIAMFFLPNLDEVIAPLPPTLEQTPARYEPISVYDWQRQFMAEYILSRYDWEPEEPSPVSSALSPHR